MHAGKSVIMLVKLWLRMMHSNYQGANRPGIGLSEIACFPGECHLCGRASAELCDSFLEALVPLTSALTLAAAQGVLPLLRHLHKLLGVLVAASPDDSRAAQCIKLSRMRT